MVRVEEPDVQRPQVCVKARVLDRDQARRRPPLVVVGVPVAQRQQGVTLPAAKKSRSIAVMVGLEGAFLGDVDVGGLFWRQFG